MKVEMAVVKADFRETRALEPAMYGKPFLVDENWVDRIERVSKGRIRRTAPGQEASLHPGEPQEQLPRRRGRPPKVHPTINSDPPTEIEQ